MDKVVEKIPTWALCYIINGDSTGLSDEDIAQVDGFFNSYRKEGLEVQIVSPQSENNGYFSQYPAFGLPCDVVDCDILYKHIKK